MVFKVLSDQHTSLIIGENSRYSKSGAREKWKCHGFLLHSCQAYYGVVYSIQKLPINYKIICKKCLRICIHPLKRSRMHAIDSAKEPFGTV